MVTEPFYGINEPEAVGPKVAFVTEAWFRCTVGVLAVTERWAM